MWYLILVLVIAVLIVLWVGIVAGVPLLMQWLAKENVLFTTVKEGTAKAIMRGDSFERFIMSFAGYHLNDPTKKGKKEGLYEPWLKDEMRKEALDKDKKQIKLPNWEVNYHGEGNKKGYVHYDDNYYDERHEWLKSLGLYWIGWPWANSVYVYGFEWNETRTDKNSDEKILSRAEPTDFIFVADFIYAIKTVGAETKDRLLVDVLTLVTVAIRNPYRALFTGVDWMRRITAAINRHVRNFVGTKGYDDLIYIAKEENKTAPEISQMWSEEFSWPIIKLTELLADEDENSPMPRGLKGKYGVEIRTADLQTVGLSGSEKEKEKQQESAAKVYNAQQEAKATLLAGQAKADVIKMTGDKEAEALEARLNVIERHKSGEMLAQVDAMRDASGAGARIIWANNPFIQVVDILKPNKNKEEGKKP